MRRRAFLATSAAFAAQLPIKGLAQSVKRPLIGILGTGAREAGARYFDGFLEGMSDLGYMVGRDYAIEGRYANSDLARLPVLAEELVRLRPEVIVASPTVGAIAAKRATSSIPIVAVTMTDPVGLGLVVSEARPGTNLTGILSYVEGLPGKLLGIALDVMPTASKFGVLLGGNNPASVVQRREIEAEAAKVRASLAAIEVRGSDEIGSALQAFARQGINIVIVAGDPIFLASRRQIAATALALRLPTVYSYRDHVEDGGLISYGTNLRRSFRRGAYFVDRILKGDKPADLPVEFPTKVELVINLATAKTLELSIPPTLLAIADEVIE